ncbi:MAG: type II toxin-antitoxin system RelE/ParE family toxin [Elusimicrobia bacterium]|nr:type II toxin-antitoxin system RelE/ParE family toxin [Elusimicrobiota bacterium]
MYTIHESYEVEVFRTIRGNCPAREFLASLPPPVRGKVSKWIQRLQQLGPRLPRPYSDLLEAPIRELRISFARLEIRLLYFFHGKRIIITHGFLKKSRQTDPREIARAQRYRGHWIDAQEKTNEP